MIINFGTMNKSIIVVLLLLFTACGKTLEIKTNENHEAVMLPDGSQLYLNHNSSISYDEDFNPRTVRLSGEAFFIVVPSTSLFTVDTAHGAIEVLGTEFNVKTTSNQIAVDVKEGLVELKTEYNKSNVKKGIKAIYKDGEQTVKQIKSNREYRKWMHSLRREFKKLGKEMKPVFKEIGNEFEKAGKKIGKEFKK